MNVSIWMLIDIVIVMCKTFDIVDPVSSLGFSNGI